MDELRIALKEWDLVVRELLAGRQAILLRKGGILDSGNHFELEHRRFALFPTFIHQDPEMVKEERRAEIRRMAQEPGEIEIAGWGEAAEILEVPSRAGMDRLREMHPWSEKLIDMRFNYRAEKPLYLVVVRAWRLPKVVRLKNTLEYAGCKSWVPLEEGIGMDGSEAAMSEGGLADVAAQIRKAFG